MPGELEAAQAGIHPGMCFAPASRMNNKRITSAASAHPRFHVHALLAYIVGRQAIGTVVENQALVWLGTLYSPLLPVFGLLFLGFRPKSEPLT